LQHSSSVNYPPIIIYQEVIQRKSICIRLLYKVTSSSGDADCETLMADVAQGRIVLEFPLDNEAEKDIRQDRPSEMSSTGPMFFGRSRMPFIAVRFRLDGSGSSTYAMLANVLNDRTGMMDYLSLVLISPPLFYHYFIKIAAADHSLHSPHSLPHPASV
jgi:hypothetical protein